MRKGLKSRSHSGGGPEKKGPKGGDVGKKSHTEGNTLDLRDLGGRGTNKGGSKGGVTGFWEFRTRGPRQKKNKNQKQ